MCQWKSISVKLGRGTIQISAQTIKDACDIILQAAKKGQVIHYSDLWNMLKQLGHRGINRGTIGSIVGEVSIQISQVTNPSIYPSAIVVRKDTGKPGEGFWGLDSGTNPPSRVPKNMRAKALQQYQHDVFHRTWNCHC